MSSNPQMSSSGPTKELSKEAAQEFERKFLPRVIAKTGIRGFTLATMMIGTFFLFNFLSREDIKYLDTVSYHRDIKIKQFKEKYFEHKPGLLPTPGRVSAFVEKVKQGESEANSTTTEKPKSD